MAELKKITETVYGEIQNEIERIARRCCKEKSATERMDLEWFETNIRAASTILAAKCLRGL